MFSTDDHRYMARAIELARRGTYTVDPNPRVGCVIVREDDGKTQSPASSASRNSQALLRDEHIVGEGWHEMAGQGHAEVRALAMASDKARGAVAYVTLEPCSHHGRTAPCVDALIKAGVRKVIAAMEDPNPKVSGKGIAALRQAGIECLTGLHEAQARRLNPGFIKRMLHNKPWVRIKLAMSLDGKTAMASGESQWITGTAARLDVQALRASSSAIITGANTVIDDDPALTVRVEDWSRPYFFAGATVNQVRQPKRIILDSALRILESARVLQPGGETIVACGESVVNGNKDLEAKRQALLKNSVQVWPMATDQTQRIDLDKLLEKLAQAECNEVLVESGPTLAGEFFRHGLWDELIVYVAPMVMGNRARSLLNLPFDAMAQAHRMQWHDITQVGEDLKLTLLNDRS